MLRSGDGEPAEIGGGTVGEVGEGELLARRARYDHRRHRRRGGGGAMAESRHGRCEWGERGRRETMDRGEGDSRRGEKWREREREFEIEDEENEGREREKGTMASTRR